MSSKKLSVAISPCPNDTFAFYAWIHGLVGQDLPIDPVMADVQTLNEWTIEGRFPVSKISIGCLPAVAEAYCLLDAGAAVGYGCGPKLVAPSLFPISELTHKRVALPGYHTTAYHLFRMLMPAAAATIARPYHKIIDSIVDGSADCGVIIHETRFTFQQQNLVEIADLGTLWELQYRLPIPLGGIVASRTMDQELRQKITSCIQQSIDYAWQHPQEAIAYALEHSQEKDLSVVKQHIDLYVTPETKQLSAAAKRSIEILCPLQ